jgi:acetyl-CoA C-acetyltransferase
MSLRDVYVVGIGRIPVVKKSETGLREMGAQVVRAAMVDAGVDTVGALYVGNMLADELQSQKHLAALIADESGLVGIEALQLRAATASGAAALRMAHLAVAGGEHDVVVAVGVEKMSDGVPTPALAKALDARTEVPDGSTLISQNARLMQVYMDRYAMPADGLAHFAVNAHANAAGNPLALFKNKQVSAEEVSASRLISPPIRLFDCSPVCDGAAAVVLASGDVARALCAQPVKIIAASVATDRFRVADRNDPLWLAAAHHSAEKAYRQAGITAGDISFFELHDAFTIMACLLLEATGFAEMGQGWRLAADGKISPDGKIPIATRGGLKARGHPIGATALYQTCEIVDQLTGRAGANQLPDPRLGMMQSMGGVAATALTHIFAAA